MLQDCYVIIIIFSPYPHKGLKTKMRSNTTSPLGPPHNIIDLSFPLRPKSLNFLPCAQRKCLILPNHFLLILFIPIYLWCTLETMSICLMSSFFWIESATTITMDLSFSDVHHFITRWDQILSIFRGRIFSAENPLCLYAGGFSGRRIYNIKERHTIQWPKNPSAQRHKDFRDEENRSPNFPGPG